jgi:hypothetical protein
MNDFILKGKAYRIAGFAPDLSVLSDERQGGYLNHGFCISLQAEFARQLALTELPEGHKLNALGIEYLKAAFGRFEDRPLQLQPKWGKSEPRPERLYDPPFRFWEDSLLVSHINVPGNACGLDIDHKWNACPMDTSDVHWYQGVVWQPHNVDSVRQAHCLLSLWLLWYKTVS